MSICKKEQEDEGYKKQKPSFDLLNTPNRHNIYSCNKLVPVKLTTWNNKSQKQPSFSF